MRLIPKQKPVKKREQYRQKALEMLKTGKASEFETKADMEDFRRVVRRMGFKVETCKDGGWFAWVK